MSSSTQPPSQLSREEIRVLGECERESLIYRSIPLGIITTLTTQYAMTRNIISTKGKWIKFGACLFAGYIIGKVSYTSACRQKILRQIPDSALADLIRGGSIPHTSSHEHMVYTPDTHLTPVAVNQYGDPIYPSK